MIKNCSCYDISKDTNDILSNLQLSKRIWIGRFHVIANKGLILVSKTNESVFVQLADKNPCMSFKHLIDAGDLSKTSRNKRLRDHRQNAINRKLLLL